MSVMNFAELDRFMPWLSDVGVQHRSKVPLPVEPPGPDLGCKVARDLVNWPTPLGLWFTLKTFEAKSSLHTVLHSKRIARCPFSKSVDFGVAVGFPLPLE